MDGRYFGYEEPLAPGGRNRLLEVSRLRLRGEHVAGVATYRTDAGLDIWLHVPGWALCFFFPARQAKCNAN